MGNNQLVVIKRVKRYTAGHHGGSREIASADFATAMMAFFLVLWLLSLATPERKETTPGYFQDPIGFSESANPYVIDLSDMSTLTPDETLNPQVQAQPDSNGSQISPKQDHQVNADQAENLAEQVEREHLVLLLQELQSKVDGSPMLKNFKDQVHFEITYDGLCIQIVDAADRPMSDLGSARLQPYFGDVLPAMVEIIRQVPNKISISSHTDAKPYASNGDFDNWELSASRANTACRALVAGGYPKGQIAQVVRYASARLSDDKDPLNPVNRRIDIVVLTHKAQKTIEDETGVPEASAPTAAPGEQPKSAAEASAADAQPSLPVDEVQKKFNLFDDSGSLKLEQIKGD